MFLCKNIHEVLCMHHFARENVVLSRVECATSTGTYFKDDFALKWGNSAHTWFCESKCSPICKRDPGCCEFL